MVESIRNTFKAKKKSNNLGICPCDPATALLVCINVLQTNENTFSKLREIFVKSERNTFFLNEENTSQFIEQHPGNWRMWLSLARLQPCWSVSMYFKSRKIHFQNSEKYLSTVKEIQNDGNGNGNGNRPNVALARPCRSVLMYS